MMVRVEVSAETTESAMAHHGIVFAGQEVVFQRPARLPLAPCVYGILGRTSVIAMR